MDNAQSILELQEKIRDLGERITALEKELRMMREDILSERAKERMQKRILEKPSERLKEIKEKMDKKIKIEI